MERSCAAHSCQQVERQTPRPRVVRGVLERCMALRPGYCRCHLPETPPEGRAGRVLTKVGVGLTVIASTVAVGVGLDAIGVSKNMLPDDVEWKFDDQVALGAAVCLSWVFLGIGFLINARQTRLSEALARGQIEERTRRMQYASLLSMKAVGNCGLEVAHNALAALPAFNLAARRDQFRFLDSLTRCYGTLVLNSFPHNSKLPLAERTQLLSATDELRVELHRLAGQWRNRRLENKIRSAERLMELSLALDRWYHESAPEPEMTADDIRLLYANELQSYCCWLDPTMRVVKEAKQNSGSSAPPQDLAAPAGVEASVERCSADDARYYLSPWYVIDEPPQDKPPDKPSPDKPPRWLSCCRWWSARARALQRPDRPPTDKPTERGNSQPEGSHGEGHSVESSAETTNNPGGRSSASQSGIPTLYEVDYSRYRRSGATPLQTRLKLDPYPKALSHDEVAAFPEFRREGISRINRLLHEAESDTRTGFVAILTYRTTNGATVVLDGNHRLAALLRQQQTSDMKQRLIVFQLREVPEGRTDQQLEAVTPSKHFPDNVHDYSWEGFNPDVCLVKNDEAVKEQPPRVGSQCSEEI